MKMNEFMANATRFAAKAKFKLGKHSPEILMVCGAVGAVTSAVMACKATLKVNDILAAHQSSVATIHDVQDGKAAIKEGAEYTEEDPDHRLCADWREAREAVCSCCHSGHPVSWLHGWLQPHPAEAQCGSDRCLCHAG